MPGRAPARFRKRASSRAAAPSSGEKRVGAHERDGDGEKLIDATRLIAPQPMALSGLAIARAPRER
jgi:hypothetical protein